MLSEGQREVMRHALGLNRVESEHRNYFIADWKSDDATVWRELVDLGYADEFPYLLARDSIRFTVTPAGLAALREEPPINPQTSETP